MKKISKKIFPILVWLVSTNFMYLDHNKPKWPLNLPAMTTVQYKINPNFGSQHNLTQQQQVDVLVNAANVWRDQGLSNFQFQYVGMASNNILPSRPASCEGSNAVVVASVFAAQTVVSDPDFPDSLASAYRGWFCKRTELIHFDIVFNDAKSWDTQKLYEVGMHEFGHALGLGHCSTKETSQECAANRPGTDPVFGMVMNKLHPFGTTKLSPDDIAGIRSLYGVRGAVPFAGNLIAIKKSVTGSNSTEVHIVRGTANYQEYAM
jgi:hypothetical protein